MKRFQILAAASLLCTGTNAMAFGIQLTNGNALSWPTDIVGYEMDVDGTSDISDGSDLVAVASAVISWNGVGCSSITLTQTGTTTSTDTILTTNQTDGTNRLAWVEDSRWQYGQYVLGITTPVFSYSGDISEADIAFNGYQSSWSTSDNSSGYKVDVESVAVHELGHLIGMQHVLNGEYSTDPPTMSPSVDPYLRTRTLSADDASGACFLYPSGAYVCGGACDCPAVVDQDYGGEFNAGRLECQGGTCAGMSTGGPTDLPLGSNCNNSDECSGEFFCQSVSGLGSYCAQGCTPSSSNCPSESLLGDRPGWRGLG